MSLLPWKAEMIKVDEHLWRGPRPPSLGYLEGEGFKRVVSLQSGFEDAFTESVYEGQKTIAKTYGIEFVDLHWSNFFPPTKKQLRDLVEYISHTKKTYIHCHSGVDRTGAACMSYRIWTQNWTFEAAHREWVNLGRHWWFFWWKHFLKRAMK